MKNSVSHQGFALVIVLAILALLIVLAVGFISRSSTERSAASGYKASVMSRQLADTAVSVVQGQINIATTQGANVAWTSQPGMVRTFNTTGVLLKGYKLYSAADMITDNVNITNGKSPDEPPTTWDTATAIWTDLNAPVEVNGTKIFPILDPTGAGSNLEDDADNTIGESFSINTAPGTTTYQPAPMPVRWLYVLKNGNIVSPAGTGASATIPDEEKDNPVVGRIGFWTDDDTCKVNINTASAGTYWDTPRGASTQEIEFAKFQPVQKEWQRYPGHPAMANLSAVFPKKSRYSDTQWNTEVYQMIPRVVGGGSTSGSVAATGAITPDSDRLYANVDELALKPDRTANTAVSRAMIEQAKFFLTARSRAPETNLFNLPRIACWPIYRLLSSGLPDTTRTTAFDRLIAFCSTVNGMPYFFQRELSSSATNDIQISRNKDLYNYLQYLTENSIPGFGNNFSAKYGADRDQILTEIFDYIRCANLQDDLLATNKRFTPSGTGMGWVAPTKFTAPGGNATLGMGRSYTVSELALGLICNAVADDPGTTAVDESAGSNIPANNPVLGGTALNTGEMYIQAIMAPEFFSVMQGWVQLQPSMRIKMRGLDTIQAAVNGSTFYLFPNVNSEAATVFPSSGNTITIWGGNPSYRLFGQGLGSPARGNIPGDTGALYPFIGIPIKVTAPPTGGTLTINAGGEVDIELYAGNSGALDSTTLIQTIKVQIPAMTMPLPKIVDKDITTAVKINWWNYKSVGGRLGMIGDNPNAGGKFFLQDYDTVRAFLPKHGDYRLTAGNSSVPANQFIPHPYAISDPTRRIAANLASTDSTGWLLGTDTRGTYIHGLTHPANFGPDMPYLDPTDATTASFWPDLTGDFDSGTSVALDGPYVNKPDEGNTKGIGTTDVPYYTTAYQSAASGTTYFSPNRQMPSPGMFGSLPTGVLAGVPWRTLLFRPQAGHFGANGPSDHLLLDFFWMPVVEPYAISDRFSTAGKINMNYQILPFTYIKRATGIRALLDSEKVAAIPITSVSTYKPNVRQPTWPVVAASNPSFRLPIDTTETLSQFDDIFKNGGIFKSASEICDIHIVPTGKSIADMKGSFWKTYALTGDNMRERVYTTLYPRLTTKSNTYTVHFRAQSLKKLASSSVGVWTEGKDIVTGEYRGSTTIERFIDANNTNIPDYAASPSNIPNMSTLDKFYRWRVVENRQFAP